MPSFRLHPTSVTIHAMSGFPRNRRRTPLILALVLIILGGIAAAWWFLWVPTWRPPLRPGETYGIDVSAHQGTVDWQAVARDDIAFAYIKATEGGDFVDDMFTKNWSAAEEVGLTRGAYHFFTLCTPGRIQAENFLRTARPDPDALLPSVDLELAGNCSQRPAAEDVYDELDTFLAMVEGAWERPVLLYLGNDFEDAYPVRERLDRPLWLRRFLLRPREPWLIWQLHGYARVDGVEGGVDLNVMRRSP